MILTRPQSLVELFSEHPSKDRVRSAIALVVLISLAFVATAPFATLPLPAVVAFVPAYQSLVFVCESITAWVFVSQYRLVGSRSLLVLGCGYGFNAVMVLAHTLSFPGLLGPSGIIGGGPQTTAYIYFLWHGAFPLFVAAYARSNSKINPDEAAARSRTLVVGMGATLLLALALLLICTVGDPWLLPIMSGNKQAAGTVAVAIPVWLTALIALVLLLGREPSTELDLWLVVVMTIWVFEIALAAVLNRARFDLGWYAGRVYGLVAGGFVLGALILKSQRAGRLRGN